MIDPFVSTAWLAERLDDTNLVVVDGSWYLPTLKRDPAAEFLAGHIPGAVRFDLDATSDPSSTLPHMLPPEERFAALMGELGISETMTIVVYDGAGLFSAPRVWWTFRIFGAPDVRILDGGFPAWSAEGRPVASGPGTPRTPTRFNAHLDRSAVVDVATVAQVLADGSAQVVDARPADRFRGEAPEPRPGLRAGHMPGSLNVPFAAVTADGRLRDADALRAAFAEAGVRLDEPIVASCGSGVSAAIVALAAARAGAPLPSIYDGSWAEWGAGSERPVATGPSKPR